MEESRYLTIYIQGPNGSCYAPSTHTYSGAAGQQCSPQGSFALNSNSNGVKPPTIPFPPLITAFPLLAFPLRFSNFARP